MYLYNATQNNSAPTFTCKVVRNPFIEAGIKRSKELIKEGSEYGLAEANKFINNLNFIKSDKSMQSVDIDAYPEDIFHFVFPGLHTVKIDGKKVSQSTIEGLDSNNFGDYCMAAVESFVQRQYGQEVLERLADRQIPELGRISELSIKLDSATSSAQRKLSGMVKTIDIQI